MANTHMLISSVTVGSGGASTITFSSIPSTYTDLIIKASLRSGYNGFADGYIYFAGGGSTEYSSTILSGEGSTTSSYRYSNSGQSAPYPLAGSNVTASTFTNIEMYVPNYAGSSDKPFSGTSGAENNSSASRNAITANLWRNSSAITGFTMSTANGFVENSTVYLYGIKKN